MSYSDYTTVQLATAIVRAEAAYHSTESEGAHAHLSALQGEMDDREQAIMDVEEMFNDGYDDDLYAMMDDDDGFDPNAEYRAHFPNEF